MTCKASRIVPGIRATHVRVILAHKLSTRGACRRVSPAGLTVWVLGALVIIEEGTSRSLDASGC